ncbi:hypothetical protein ABF215_12495 [Fusobacterium sp. THCT13E1]
MAQFNGMVVTNKGRELLARTLASKGKFIITAVALGDGAYSGNLRECEELVSKKLDLILLGVYSEKGSTKITVGITNKNVSESFRTNEIGVYARLEGDTKAILYAYDVAVEADTMPNNSLGTTLELVYDIYFDVSSEVEVTLEITDSIAFLTQDIAKREFLKTYIVSGGDLKGRVQLEADKQYLADDGKWYQNIGGDRVWEKSGVPDELLIEISWKTLMDEIAKKENKILVKNTAFNKNFGTAENEVLEGIQLARTLGLEYGGELNNSNTKTIDTVYYDTQNKSFFKCFQENTLNYADSSCYKGISNNDLLLKLQNLITISETDEIYIDKAYKGQILNISFKRTYKNIPIVIVGQEKYISSILGTTRIKIFNVTRTGFSLVVLETTIDYSPSFPYIVI